MSFEVVVEGGGGDGEAEDAAEGAELEESAA